MTPKIYRPLIFLFSVLSVFSVVNVEAAAEKKESAETALPPKHEQTGTAFSKSSYVHHVILFDAQEPEAKRVQTSGDLVLPFSTKSTCGHCHEYARVSSGWHFNAWDDGAQPGRPGEPWFWTYRKIGVQLPLSQRPWEGTYRPGDVGMTPWLFLQRFGHHMPGGGVGEKFVAGDKDAKARWTVTGGLEINCLGCHNTGPGQDMALPWVQQLYEQNFMWGATATSSLGTVKGSCRKMPMSWDRFEAPDPDNKSAPALKYDLAHFDPDGKVLMQLSRQMPAERCYFCHSTAEVGPGAPAHWQTDDDVHIAAGMKCTACHRNGLDHDIVRGYEGEVGGAAFTCQGCHYGASSGAKGAPAMPGRLGAPRPAHRGLPNFHFEKLSCTACHSGPQPGLQIGHVQTSRAHMLEMQGAHRTDDALPYIVAPVFMPQSDGKIGAHRMVWPAFWARIKDEKILPLSPDKVVAEAGDILDAPAQGKPGDKSLTEDKIAKILQALAKDTSTGQPVYVSGGLMYSNKNADWSAVALVSAAHPAARPTVWPLAHNVRPAQQALGAGGCPDCHSKSSPFFHGQVPVESFVAGERPTIAMSTLMGEDALLLRVWEVSFIFRTLFVLFCVASSVFVTGAMLWYLGRGVSGLSRLWR